MARAYAAILGQLPRPVAFGFAYGSGVKQQAGQNAKGQVLDLVLAVDSAEGWHARNLQINRSHYSALGSMGAGAVAAVQQRSGAGTYFNTLLPLPEHQLLYKYGVTTTHQLVQDLRDWPHIYLAGRLHKPVEILVQPTQDLTDALHSNLSSAVRAALLLLPEKFTEYQLYHTISNLSYSGDFRMIFGENKNKVKNIVQPQLEGFKKLYLSTINAYSEFMHLTNDEIFIQDVTTDAKFNHLSKLPARPKEIIYKTINKKDSNSSADDILKYVAQNDSDKIVQRSLQSIVWQSSVRQSLKGILTAGLLKSLIYSARKIKKMF